MGFYKLTYKQTEFVRANSVREAESKCYDMFEDGPSSIHATAVELHPGDPEYEEAKNELGDDED